MTRPSRPLAFLGLGAAAAAVAAVAVPPAASAAAPVAGGALAASPDALGAGSTGTYESCSAWFGYGKGGGFPAVELTTFDVVVEGGPVEGPAPTVANGAVDVVLVLTDTEGATARCVPEQVTEAQWAKTWADSPAVIPAYPGPGHYVYPVALGALPPTPPPTPPAPPAGEGAVGVADIPGLEVLAKVGFEVVGVDAPLTLVSPTVTSSLPQVFVDLIAQFSVGQLPAPFAAAITDSAGPAATAAFETALSSCIATMGSVIPDPDSEDLIAAIQTVFDRFLRVDVPPVTAPVVCTTLGVAFQIGWYTLGVTETIATTSTITVSAPPPTPESVTPRFTG